MPRAAAGLSAPDPAADAAPGLPRAGLLSRHLPALGAALLACLAVVATLGDYGLTWDEPEYYRAARSYLAWLRLLGQSLAAGDLARPFGAEAIDAHFAQVFWPMHPAFPRLVGGVSLALFSDLLGPVTAFRLGNVAFVGALALGLHRLAADAVGERYGTVAVAALLLMPRFFAHTHFAALDLPITAMWLLAVHAFRRGIRSRGWSVAWGVILGLALATKFHAFFIPLPLFAWGWVYHRSGLRRNLVSLAAISPIVFLVNQPYFFPAPLARLAHYLELALTRASYHPITTLYLGEVHAFSPPWHYPLVMIATTVPVTVLAFALLGAAARGRALRADDHALLVANALLPPALTILPRAPIHDGVRLFLPCFPFIAVLAAAGLKLGIDAVRTRVGPVRPAAGAFLAAILLLPPLVSLARIHPLEGGYFNALIGGVSGARAAGMETTYWGEVLNRRVLGHFNRTFEPGATITARAYYQPTLDAYREFGLLRPDLRRSDAEPGDYLVLIWRQGFFTPLDRRLAALPPVYRVEHDGVPFLTVYRRGQLGAVEGP